MRAKKAKENTKQKLPAGYVQIPAAESARLLELRNNMHTPNMSKHVKKRTETKIFYDIEFLRHALHLPSTASLYVKYGDGSEAEIGPGEGTSLMSLFVEET